MEVWSGARRKGTETPLGAFDRVRVKTVPASPAGGAIFAECEWGTWSPLPWRGTPKMLNSTSPGLSAALAPPGDVSDPRDFTAPCSVAGDTGPCVCLMQSKCRWSGIRVAGEHFSANHQMCSKVAPWWTSPSPSVMNKKWQESSRSRESDFLCLPNAAFHTVLWCFFEINTRRTSAWEGTTNLTRYQEK